MKKKEEQEVIHLLPLPKESSTLAGYMYNNKTKDLYIGFKNKMGVVTYQYKNVHMIVVAAFLKAESQGKFFHAHIKDKYETIKL